MVYIPALVGFLVVFYHRRRQIPILRETLVLHHRPGHFGDLIQQNHSKNVGTSTSITMFIASYTHIHMHENKIAGASASYP